MNREHIIQMAKISGAWDFFEADENNFGDVRAFERFAAAIRAATKEEDARIVDNVLSDYPSYEFSMAIRESK